MIQLFRKEVIKKGIKDIFIPCLIGFFIAIFANRFICFSAYVPSASMEPEIMTGDTMLVSRLISTKDLDYGDVVVFKSKEFGKTFVKRLIAKGGDIVHLKANGDVYVNGELLEEDYVKEEVLNQKEQVFDVPKGSFFFLGDNRNHSADARVWENPFISEEDVLGKALCTIYPFSHMGLIK